ATSSAADIQVSVVVTNTGTREGDEIAQLYMRQNTSSVETPSRSLEGFSRVHLKPRETRTVVFHVPQRQLALWSTENRWVVEPGKYTVWVGGSSRAILSTQFV